MDCGDFDSTLEYGTLVASDNCDTEVAYTWTNLGIVNQIGEGCYQMERSYSVVDDCGNTALLFQTITVLDTEAPVFTYVPADYTVECGTDLALENATATDNCQPNVVITVDEVTTDGDCPQEYTLTRTFTADDGCGNITQAVQVITVVDTTKPVFVAVAQDQTNQCTETPYAYEAQDVCGDVTYSESRTVISEDACGNYEHLVTITATDACGNSESFSFTIIVNDTTAPVFVEALPADATVECDAVPAAAVLTVTDNCDAAASVAYTEVRTDGACDQTYTLTRTWVGSDCAGNTVTHVQTLEVEDTTAPVLDLAANVTLECSTYDAGTVFGGTITDACSEIEIQITDAPVSGGCVAPVGSYIRFYVVTDACGNSAEFMQILHLQDTTAPVVDLTCPADITVEADGVCAIDLSTNATGQALATASDNCQAMPNLQVTYVDTPHPATSCSGTFVVERTWTAVAVDHCNNETTQVCTQVITVVVNDDQDPLFVEDLPADATVECDAVPDPAMVTATDNCDVDVDVDM